MRTIEVCFTPALYQYKVTSENYVVVVVDILRATTAICAAFDHEVEAIIPVADIELARKYKEQGYLVTAERDGLKLDFADFANSVLSFRTPVVKGKEIVYCTTNGTQAIEMAAGADKIVLGAFSILSALTRWLEKADMNVVILCAGWKNRFNLEDSVFAGALTERLLESGTFKTECDSTNAALNLWSIAKVDLPDYIDKAEHSERLRKLGLNEEIPYSLSLDESNIIPVWKEGKIRGEQA